MTYKLPKIKSDFEFEAQLGALGFTTLANVYEELRCLANDMSTHKALADKMGISPQYLHDILAGKRLPGKKVLAFLKLEPVLVYRDAPENSK